MWMRRALRAPLLRTIDVFESAFGLTDPLVPPRAVRFVGSGDFRRIGEQYAALFQQHGHIGHDSVVLDIGSGIGRMAGPLTRVIGPGGRYEGFDIVASGVEWCQQHITPRYPQFRFQLADVHNPVYHPGGRQQAHEYRFPFPDATFDFVFATSVFTHMLSRDVARYLAEIARVLRPGGRSLLTWFVIDDGVRQRSAAGQAEFAFAHRHDGCFVEIADRPEEAVGYEVSELRQLYQQAGLQVIDPILYGQWSGRSDFTDHQDIVLAARERA
ncbi:MAG: class I SAM-dependent methyltransferase [Acidobacteriota bacterium]